MTDHDGQDDALLDAITAILPPLMTAMETLAVASRHLHPPKLKDLVAQLGELDAPVRNQLTGFRDLDWPEHLIGFKQRVETAGDAEVAEIDLQNPSFGAASAGVITLLGVTLSDLSAVGGTTVQASIFDRDGTKQLEVTVGTGGTEIIIISTVIVATEQVDLTALTLTVPTGP